MSTMYTHDFFSELLYDFTSPGAWCLQHRRCSPPDLAGQSRNALCRLFHYFTEILRHI